MKKNWLIILVLFLLSINVALVATLLIRGYNRNSDKICGWNKEGNRNNGEHRFEDHLARELCWNAEQSKRAYAFGAEFQAKKSFYTSQLDSIREIYYTQLSEEKPDTSILHSLADKLGRIKGDMIMLDYQHYRNLRLVCTPAQATKMDSLGKIYMIERHKRECPKQKGCNRNH